MITKLLSPSEYNPYFEPYINNSADVDILKGLRKNRDDVTDFFNSIPVDKHNYAYAEGKWTTKDILVHNIDVERIFAYRALRIARNDTSSLLGFDHNSFVDYANATQRDLKDILKEYNAVREATLVLFESFNSNALKNVGEASGSPISVRALGYIITGHENHHISVIKERYL